MLQRLAIIGAGGLGRESLFYVREMYTARGHRLGQHAFDVVGFVDSNPRLHHTSVCDVPVLGPVEWLFDNLEVRAICAIGSPRIRRDIVETIEPFGVQFATVQHPTVVCSQYVELGPGAMLCAGVVLTTQIRAGKQLLINMNVSVGHDCLFGDYVTIDPGCNISGNVTIHSGVELGSNVSVIPGRCIGEGAVVGAGAVVTCDLAPNHLYVGVPAKPVRRLEPFRPSESNESRDPQC
jgi:sugar O-acyltransferase (sialic acid O-acetyltransferase NeuD family)